MPSSPIELTDRRKRQLERECEALVRLFRRTRSAASPRRCEGRAPRVSTNARVRGSRRASRSRGGDSGDPDPDEGDPDALKLREAATA
jgi:hypothetical protein